MSMTVAQIFALNPSTTILDGNLIYMVESPYTPGTDTAILGSDLKSLFLSSSAIVMPAQGGTGVNNGTSLITVGGNFTMSGAFSFAGILTGNAAITFPTSGTLATTSQIPSVTPSALTEVNDTNVTLTLGGAPSTALLQAVSLTLGWSGLLGLSRGGTNANLSATGGASQVLRQSTTGAAITVSQLAASDLSNGATGTGLLVLQTSPTLITPTLGVAIATSIRLPTSSGGILDTNGNPVLQVQAIASSVNFFSMNNNATGSFPTISSVGSDSNIAFGITSKGTGSIMLNGNSNGQALAIFTGGTSLVNQLTFNASSTFLPVSIAATGTDTNIYLNLLSKGNAGVNIQGVTDGSGALAGVVGQIVQSVIASGAAVSLTTNVVANITSISLTAGDWDVWGNISFIPGGATLGPTDGWINTVSATVPNSSLYAGDQITVVAPTAARGYCVPGQHFTLMSTTTLFLSCVASFSVAAQTVCGGIYARRRR